MMARKRKKIDFSISQEEKMERVLRITDKLIETSEMDLSRAGVWRFFFLKGMEQTLAEDQRLASALPEEQRWRR